MPTKTQVEQYIKSQQSLHLYPKVRKALQEVLLSMSQYDFRTCTHNLIMMVIHEGAIAQVMHFHSKTKFKVAQLSVAKKIPTVVLRYVLAHELGHVMQGRNWKKSDGNKLEADADNWAKKWGFIRTKKIGAWMNHYALYQQNL
jgi:hypothetical protein